MARKRGSVTAAKSVVSRRDPEPSWGPAMRALPEKWRLAVQHLFQTKGNQTEALRLAGYVATPKSMKVMASRIFGDDRVRAAVREEAGRQIDVIEPELLAILREIMTSPAEKAADRLRAVGMIWERARPVVTHHRVEVEHHLSDDERDMQHWHALKRLGAPAEAFLQRFGPNGVARVEALVLAEEARRREIEAPTIEGVDYDEVE